MVSSQIPYAFLVAIAEASDKTCLSAKYLRNRSFTKGEIETYWRLKKRTEEEHRRSILSGLLETSQENGEQKESGVLRVQRSNSAPPANVRESITNMESETDLESIVTKNAWWTRSNWAFLNEPPVILTESPSYKYASQHQVINFCSSKTDTV
ncbi:hypothetical protein NE237_018332 [Protea cynaroides]|uniref:Uncharacterized protein n=1 Tax=Protea cynaroides TaxID=273540 RepID=A0A9Q0K9P7_9MAGN|nr:hypothetical protein NE237_018332 [Protea cynaroides]